MAIEAKDIKHFNMRLPKETWLFLKQTSAAQEVSMTDIIVKLSEDYRKKLAKKLTSVNTNV